MKEQRAAPLTPNRPGVASMAAGASLEINNDVVLRSEGVGTSTVSPRCVFTWLLSWG